MKQLILSHPAWSALVAYALFSNAIGTMPVPTAQSNAGYQWLYKFAHGFASNILYAVTLKFPQLPAAVGDQGQAQGASAK